MTVHPRIRGERENESHGGGFKDGSSPHTRGTPAWAIRFVAKHRFIPAYAGNAFLLQHQQVSRTVHPRIRGERPAPGSRIGGNGGSSPHTRGTLGTEWTGMAQSRFIPAYAGNALNQLRLRQEAPVHPRIRGERCTIGIH